METILTKKMACLPQIDREFDFCERYRGGVGAEGSVKRAERKMM